MPRPKKVDANSNAPAKINNSQKKTTSSNSKQPTANEMREWYEKNKSRLERYEDATSAITSLRDIQKSSRYTSISNYSKEDVKSYIKNISSNEKNLRSLSRYLYYRSEIYYRLCKYYANQIDLTIRNIVPPFIISGDFQTDLDDSIQDVIKNLDDNFSQLINNIDSHWNNETITSLMEKIQYVATDSFNNVSADGKISESTGNVVSDIQSFMERAWAKYDRDAETTQQDKIDEATKEKVKNNILNNSNSGSSSGSSTDVKIDANKLISRIDNPTNKISPAYNNTTTNTNSTAPVGKVLSTSQKKWVNDFLKKNIVVAKQDVSKYGSVTDSTCPTWSSDTPRYKGSYAFNGNKQVIDTPNVFHQEDITISFWFKRLKDTNTRQFLFTIWEGFSCELTADDIPLFRIATDVSHAVDALSDKKITVNDGWTHFCGVYKNGEYSKIYINGQLKKSVSSASKIYWNIHSSKIGIYNSLNTYYNGQISDVRIYATALSDSDILELYQSSASVDNNGNLMLAGEVIEE